MKYVPPSVQETAFNCPRCGALASQQWYSLVASRLSADEPVPRILDAEGRRGLTFDDIEDTRKRAEFSRMADKLVDGQPVLGETDSSRYGSVDLLSVFVSRCFNCKDVTVWIHDKLIFPQKGEAPPANADLPDEIRRDYEEASSILDLSPRGAAALIRLAIQKLCKEHGKPGKDLNKDIGALVSDGLHQDIQIVLDVVRVIGNNAVHPGQIDLRDDRATAETLFSLLNLIVERTISQPRRIKEVYRTLPEDSRKAIEGRDLEN